MSVIKENILNKYSPQVSAIRQKILDEYLPQISATPATLRRGMEKFGASLPSVVGGLIQETGERAEEEPGILDQIVAQMTPIGGDIVYYGKKLLSSLAKKTDIDERIAKIGSDIVAKNTQWVEEKFPQQRTPYLRFMENVGAGAGSLALAVGLSLLTKNPTTASVAFGVIAKSNAYTEARQKGFAPKVAGPISTAVGTGEALLEKVGLDFLLRKFSTPIKTHLIHMTSEGLQETLQSLSEAGIKNITGVQQQKISEVLKNAGYEGLIGSILGGTASVALHRQQLINNGVKKDIADKALNNVQSKTKQFVESIAKSIQKPGLVIEEQPQAIQQEQTPVQKLITALKSAKSVRGKQETLYTKERGRRMARALAVGEKVRGEKGYYAETGQLKGEMTKAQFESIRSAVGQENIDALFNELKDSPLLNEWDKLTARKGLAKMFGEYGGKVPTKGELDLLNRVFGDEFTKTILGKRSIWEKLKEAGFQLANIPRSIMASFDLSAPFRQGLFLIGKPKQFFGSFGSMFKAFGSTKAFDAIQENIISRNTYKLMTKSKLALTGIDRLLEKREEEFMSQWAEKIPIVGAGVKASERAYVGFLNKLRADVFDDLVKKAHHLGLKPTQNMDLLKGIAGFVNNATGRGSLGGLERAGVALNSFFFSPRLMASRLNLLNPVYYIKQDPFVRKEALKSLFSLAGISMTAMALASMAGAKVERDPRNADFGKIKIGNTRIDILGGFQQYIKIAAQLITGKIVSSTSGKVFTLGEGYKPITRLDILGRSVEYKTAPVASFAMSLLRGTTAMAEEFQPLKEVGRRFVPMVAQDVVDIAKDNPDLLPLSALGVFGMGLQTYGGEMQEEEKPQQPTSNIRQQLKQKYGD